MSEPATGMESAVPELRGTVTQEQEWRLMDEVNRIYGGFYEQTPNSRNALLKIKRDKHLNFLNFSLQRIPAALSVFDANRPWLCYWIIHSIALLGESIDPDIEHKAIDFLSRCQDKNGGYGGGPGQMPHLATTYAAVSTLITLGGHRSLSSIDRRKTYSFLRRMKHASGGFRMHDDGEIDIRACYTAIAVASVLNILDNELTQNVGDYILSCQTYEGGIAGEPGSEAHGGYTYCGLATMFLVNEVNRLDLARLTDWLVFKQGLGGGFQGRTNKLVDGCYSFWQGGAAVLLQRLLAVTSEGNGSIDVSDSSEASDISEDETSHVNETCHDREEGRDTSDQVGLCNIGSTIVKGGRVIEPLFQSLDLQHYLLLCSQVEDGGFKDKPGKHRDHYHTCYCLSGLSAAQYSTTDDPDMLPLRNAVVGPYSNILEQTNPLYNIVLERYNEAHEFFAHAS